MGLGLNEGLGVIAAGTNGGCPSSIEVPARYADQVCELYQGTVDLGVFEAGHVKAQAEFGNDYCGIGGCVARPD